MYEAQGTFIAQVLLLSVKESMRRGLAQAGGGPAEKSGLLHKLSWRLQLLESFWGHPHLVSPQESQQAGLAHTWPCALLLRVSGSIQGG